MQDFVIEYHNFFGFENVNRVTRVTTDTVDNACQMALQVMGIRVDLSKLDTHDLTHGKVYSYLCCDDMLKPRKAYLTVQEVLCHAEG